MEEIKEENAIIDNYHINIDCGCIVMGIGLRMDGNSYQEFLSDLFLQSNGKLGYLGYSIRRILDITEQTNLKDIVGCAVRIKHTNMSISSIGHIYKDDWFTPKEDFK